MHFGGLQRILKYPFFMVWTAIIFFKFPYFWRFISGVIWILCLVTNIPKNSFKFVLVFWNICGINLPGMSVNSMENWNYYLCDKERNFTTMAVVNVCMFPHTHTHMEQPILRQVYVIWFIWNNLSFGLRTIASRKDMWESWNKILLTLWAVRCQLCVMSFLFWYFWGYFVRKTCAKIQLENHKWRWSLLCVGFEV